MRSSFISFLRQSFYVRMILLMLIVSVIPLIVMAYSATKGFTHMFKDEVNKLNYQVVTQIADRINVTMTRMQQLSYHYALLTPIQEALQSPTDTFADFVRKKELITTLDSGITIMGDVQALGLYSTEDQYIVSSNESYLPIFNSSYHTIVQHFNQSNHSFMFFDKDLSEVNSQLLQDSSLFLRSIPIGSITNRKGVLIFSIHNDLFKNLLENIDAGTMAAAYVVTPSLNVIASTSRLDLDEQKSRIRQIVAEWNKFNHPNQFVFEDSLISIHQSELYHRWIVLSEIPMEEAMSATKTINKTVYYLLIFLIFLGIFIVFGLGYYLYKPLQTLKRHINFFKQGQFDIRIPELANNEIGQLGTILNSMAAKLQSLVEELKHTEELKRRNEIRALQSQINPHFIYNSLNTISMFAMLRDYPKIKDLMTRLTSLLRYSMENLEQTVPISKEIDYLHDYIHMLQLRYDRRFHLISEIQTGFEKMYIPKLLLQPLIENAIFHGILAKETEEGTIVIRIKSSERSINNVVIEVEDDGAGMSPHRLRLMEMQLLKESVSENIGLINVWNRVKLFYGPRSSIELESHVSQGTIIRMTIPRDMVRTEREEAYEQI